MHKYTCIHKHKNKNINKAEFRAHGVPTMQLFFVNPTISCYKLYVLFAAKFICQKILCVTLVEFFLSVKSKNGPFFL